MTPLATPALLSNATSVASPNPQSEIRNPQSAMKYPLSPPLRETRGRARQAINVPVRLQDPSQQTSQ